MKTRQELAARAEELQARITALSTLAAGLAAEADALHHQCYSTPTVGTIESGQFTEIAFKLERAAEALAKAAHEPDDDGEATAGTAANAARLLRGPGCSWHRNRAILLNTTEGGDITAAIDMGDGPIELSYPFGTVGAAREAARREIDLYLMDEEMDSLMESRGKEPA